MTVAAIDTHEVVKELQAAGFTESQAEAVSRVVRQAQIFDLSNLATKADLAETGARLEASILATKADFAETGARLEASILATKADFAETGIKLEASIAQSRANLETRIAETKAEILKWLISTVGLQAVAIIGAVITLVRLLR